MITVVGIFEDPELAEEASSYLQANDFKSENVDVHTNGPEIKKTDRIGEFFGHLLADENEAAHFASIGRSGSIVTVHAASAREANEAVDVFNTYGAVDINSKSSLVIEQVVDDSKRLKGGD